MQRTTGLFLIFVFGALISLTGCGKPMYVATLGARVYHVSDCEHVQKSLEKYGPIKRLNYHSECQRALSGRLPCPVCIAKSE